MNINFITNKGRLLFFLIVLFGLSLTIYLFHLRDLFYLVLKRNDSSHGIFVPFISAYILYIRFDRIKFIKHELSLFPAILFFFAGFIFFYIGSITSFSLSLSVLSLVFITGGLILFFFWKKIFSEVSFPLFFLSAMIPFPPIFYDNIAYLMRQINTFFSVLIIKFFGVPVYREDFTIYLPGINMFVSDGCSGIRYLLSYFTFSVVYAFLFRHGFVSRMLVVLSAIPLSLLAGISRLSVIFLSAHYISPVLADHKPHIVLSWIIFIIWLLVPVWIDQIFLRNKKAQLQN